MRRLTPSPSPYPNALGQGGRDNRRAREELLPPPNALGGQRGVGAGRRKGEVE